MSMLFVTFCCATSSKPDGSKTSAYIGGTEDLSHVESLPRGTSGSTALHSARQAWTSTLPTADDGGRAQKNVRSHTSLYDPVWLKKSPCSIVALPLPWTIDASASVRARCTASRVVSSPAASNPTLDGQHVLATTTPGHQCLAGWLDKSRAQARPHVRHR